ncbi:MAG: hypothetical protein LBN33_06835, partial [Desulfovibrio sp.]|nr:hypothetical protein [Desulfovibrio sp.]
MATSKIAFKLEDIKGVTYDKETNDILFVLNDGSESTVNLKAISNVGNFEFGDGTVLSVKDLANAFEVEELTTAAGPGPVGGGSGANYDVDAGELIGGVDGIGKLGTDQWGAADLGALGFATGAGSVGQDIPASWDLGGLANILSASPLQERSLRLGEDPANKTRSGQVTLTAGTDAISNIGFANLTANPVDDGGVHGYRVDGISVEGIEGGMIWVSTPGSVAGQQIITGYRDLDGDGHIDDLNGNGIDPADAIIKITLTAPTDVAPGATATVNVTVELINPVHNTDGTSADLVINGLALKAEEADGEVREAGFTLTVVDDVPTDLSFTGDTEHDAGTVYDGTWGVDLGADGAVAGTTGLTLSVEEGGFSTALNIPVVFGTPIDVSIDGINYGTITLNSDGTFVFNSEGDTVGDLVFHLTATDSDGDTIQLGDGNGFTVIVTPPVGDLPHVGTVDPDGLHEKNLADGTA